MNLLALDTSTEYLSLALLTDHGVFNRHLLARQAHSALLLPTLSGLLAEARLTRQQIDAIAFGHGPGSFTGLRIAAGVAQGLAFGLDIPLLGISTLEALAEASGGEAVITALDARMQQVYLAAYQRAGENWQMVLEAGVYDPTNLPPLPHADWLATGSGFDSYPALAHHFAPRQQLVAQFPTAHAIGQLALRQLASGPAPASRSAELLYLRNKVAQTIAEREKA